MWRMREWLGVLAASCVLGLPGGVFACGGYESHLVQMAASEDPAESAEAVARLRERGPAGLRAMLAVHAGVASNESSDIDPGLRARVLAAIDAVSGQRDGHVSRLYWYTDFEAAKRAAAESGKPILSLRLLGKLTDEFSCANSRFFRTALYANEQVSNVLRDRFVLHWESVRPVPRVTIDFGDGRKLERTLTGNSIHYVLDADGRPLDALPGLYGPAAFLRGIERGQHLAALLRKAPASKREGLHASYHQQRHRELTRAFDSDRARIGPRLTPEFKLVEQAGGGPVAALVIGADARIGRNPPPARRAAAVAVSKSGVELPILAAAELGGAPEARDAASLTDDDWRLIAALHAEEAELDERSLALIRRENPTAAEAGRAAESKRRVEDPLVRMIREFESSIALDTVRNEYLLHRTIHQWLAEASDVDVRSLNERVYAELFLTPNSDPWLGMAPADTYTALSDAGVVCAAQR